jgi:hypothetical protein
MAEAKNTIQDILAGALEAPSAAKVAAAQRGQVDIIFADPCKVGGKHIDMGEVVTIDLNVAGDRATLGALHQAGRVALASDGKAVADIKARRDQRDAEFKAARKAATAAPEATTPEITDALMNGVVEKLKAAGFTITDPVAAKK